MKALVATDMNFIGGEWVKAPQAVPNLNPSNTDDCIGEFARSESAQVDAAVIMASGAFSNWRESTPQQRCDILEGVGVDLLANKEAIGDLLSREEGKTLAEGIGEVVRAAQVFKFFAQEALRITGDSQASIRPGVDVEVTREPLGVVGIVTPWNFPIAIPAWKIAPALAYGNTVVFKPAELTPACGYVIAQFLEKAGCPAGVFNLVGGKGSVVGDAIVEHADIAAVSFTGSVPVGRGVAAKAGKSLKKVQLEMGGKNPMVVMDDADLDIAVEACLNGAFYSTGQRCTASSRLIVEKGIHDRFVERITAGAKKLVVGDARDSKTQIGPVVSESQLKSNLSYNDVARMEGAEVIGGERIEEMGNGFYQRPALFLGATNDMRISQEEIFGPTACVIKADDFEHALSLANDTLFGLSSGICTSSLKHAREFKRRSSAGMAMVNLPTAGVDYHVPFGGRKGSSFGPREQGRHAADFYTTTKTAYTFAG
jgi:aldehyde dehydrogenase (NAD+)